MGECECEELLPEANTRVELVEAPPVVDLELAKNTVGSLVFGEGLRSA